MKRIVVASVLALLMATSCGGDDGGDLEAFCDLVAAGAGDLTGGEVDADALDRLVSVAPEQVRPAVEQLRNLARDFGEIDPTELDQLFAAAFDVDARSARQSFDEFAEEACNVDNATTGGQPTPTNGSSGEGAAELLIDLGDFLESRFPDDEWIDKARLEIVTVPDDGPWAVRVTFVTDPDEGEAAEACRRVSVWLYDVEGHDGSIEVIDSGDVVAARAGTEGSCVDR